MTTLQPWTSSAGFLRFRYSRTKPYAALRFSKSLLSASRQRVLLILALLLFVSACRFSLDELRTMNLEGKDFNKALAREYRLLAQKKAANAGWWDADLFAEKGLLAAQGGMVEPELPENWNIPLDRLAPLQEARRTLLDTVTGTAVTLSPEASARAIVLYDCWVEQAEDNIRPAELEECRAGFFETINYLSITKESVADKKILDYGKVEQEEPKAAKLETARPEAAGADTKGGAVMIPEMHPYTMPKSMELRMPRHRTIAEAMHEEPKSLAWRVLQPANGKRPAAHHYLIAFAASSAKLSDSGLKIVEKVAGELRGIEQYEVILNGHTDEAEIAEDAMALSRRRAESVKRALVKKGVDKGRIQLYGFGESDPAVPADGKKHPENRRVQVFIQ